MRIINPEKCVVFFDFDNTISTYDVFDSMLPLFSRDNLWRDLEEKWRKGAIGSKDCLEGQIKGMSITQEALDKYLSSVRLDPYFKRLVKFLNSRKIKTIVLSDNFDYILKRILDYHAVKRLKVYSNKMRFAKEKIMPYFPFRSDKCYVCAHCKTKNLLENVHQDSIIIYIGDGRSDICPAQYADIVFAKDELLEHYKDAKAVCFAYKSLKDVYYYFKRSIP